MTFKKYTKIKILGHEENKDIFSNPTDEIVIQEKVDGANFRFMVTGDDIIFGSRTQQLEESKEHKYSKNFQRCIEHVTKAFSELDDDTKKASNGKLFYGECMVKHTMNYDWDKIPPFLGFDIYATQNEKYLNFKNVTKLYDSWNLSVVPFIEIKYAKDIKEVNDDIVPISKYAVDNQQAEGIVFKNYDNGIFAKYVRNEFKERNAETFGGNPKYNPDETDNSKIAHMYCTNPRIDKCIFKLVDNGEKLDMPLMKFLPNMVYNDIMEEEWRNILDLKNRYKLNLGELRRIITKRCLAVLRQVIVNSALEKS